MDTSLPAERVVHVLAQVVACWANRRRFISWCAERGIELRYIQPGESDQKAFIEHYNGTDRTEVLNAYVFESVDQMREITAEWLQRYNEEQRHDALAGLSPATYQA